MKTRCVKRFHPLGSRLLARSWRDVSSGRLQPMLLLLYACKAASNSLHAAAEQGDAHALHAALAAGEGPNTRDADSYTPLHLSAGSMPHRARTPD